MLCTCWGGGFFFRSFITACCPYDLFVFFLVQKNFLCYFPGFFSVFNHHFFSTEISALLFLFQAQKHIGNYNYREALLALFKAKNELDSWKNNFTTLVQVNILNFFAFSFCFQLKTAQFTLLLLILLLLLLLPFPLSFSFFSIRASLTWMNPSNLSNLVFIPGWTCFWLLCTQNSLFIFLIFWKKMKKKLEVIWTLFAESWISIICRCKFFFWWNFLRIFFQFGFYFSLLILPFLE